MARVTIGVPVFNGGALLADSLACLASQTHSDIEILIGDNASTDQTCEICAAQMAKDSRFRHIRRPENIGSLANFDDLLARADSPFFLWRAHDDLSAPDYVEKLLALHDARPDTLLAVSEIRTEMDDKPAPRISSYRGHDALPPALRAAGQMLTSHASWIYGLWQRAHLAEEVRRVREAYGRLWGWDHLTFLPAILSGRVAGTNETSFRQRIFRAGISLEDRAARLPSAGEMIETRAAFRAYARARIAEGAWSAPARAVLHTALPAYTAKRSFSHRLITAQQSRERA